MNCSAPNKVLPDFAESDVILVTGASSGIGAGIASLLNSLGATVIASGRSQEKLNALRNDCAEPERFHLEPKDLLDEMDALPKWVSGLVAKYGKLKGMVCSAGIASPMPLQLMELEKARRIFDINYFVPMLLAKGFCDRRNNAGRGAAILFLGSMAATNPLRAQVAYTGSKAAVVASAKGISLEYSSAGIRVNCISPAEVATPLFYGFSEELGDEAPEESVSGRYPLGIGSPGDIAPLAAFLLSDQAGWITGQNYILDGGYNGCGANW
ncbi:SDR family oxidoreductase [Desulfovibrio sp. OttesenSCG-928-C06]|nr:SDR family oxidoreductase [Desulfovibrio sp. OttesenSCG-928-C06]